MGKFNVKTTDRKTIEVEGKLVKSSKPPKPPKWFANWTQYFEKRIDKRFDKQEQFNNEQKQFNNKQEKFNKKQEEFNNKIENDLKIIKSLPTIKKELKELQ